MNDQVEQLGRRRRPVYLHRREAQELRVPWSRPWQLPGRGLGAGSLAERHAEAEPALVGRGSWWGLSGGQRAFRELTLGLRGSGGRWPGCRWPGRGPQEGHGGNLPVGAGQQGAWAAWRVGPRVRPWLGSVRQPVRPSSFLSTGSTSTASWGPLCGDGFPGSGFSPGGGKGSHRSPPLLVPPSRVCHTRLSARPWEAARLAPSERPALAGSPLTEQLPAGSRAALKDAPFTGGDTEAQVRASDLASGSTSVWRLPNRAGCCLWASVFRL